VRVRGGQRSGGKPVLGKRDVSWTKEECQRKGGVEVQAQQE
jgi:hypothetical protein